MSFLLTRYLIRVKLELNRTLPLQGKEKAYTALILFRSGGWVIGGVSLFIWLPSPARILFRRSGLAAALRKKVFYLKRNYLEDKGGRDMAEKGGVIDLVDMVNAKIKAFCLENGLYWINQSMEFIRSSRIVEGVGHSAAVKVTLTFSAYYEDEPYRSALGYGSEESKEDS